MTTDLTPLFAAMADARSLAEMELLASTMPSPAAGLRVARLSGVRSDDFAHPELACVWSALEGGGNRNAVRTLEQATRIGRRRKCLRPYWRFVAGTLAQEAGIAYDGERVRRAAANVADLRRRQREAADLVARAVGLLTGDAKQDRRASA